MAGLAHVQALLDARVTAIQARLADVAAALAAGQQVQAALQAELAEVQQALATLGLT